MRRPGSWCYFPLGALPRVKQTVEQTITDSWEPLFKGLIRLFLVESSSYPGQVCPRPRARQAACPFRDRMRDKVSRDLPCSYRYGFDSRSIPDRHMPRRL
ncbi:hypothetical protein GCM10018779_24920 [Streptomyces griseocarneus]|nr:hypothetical protein GCM10018779_24920 [Streptomyces griseocarneus]